MFIEIFLTVFVIVVTLVLFVLKYVLPKSIKFELKGKHVLITGGSSGIGKALAMEIFGAGSNVTLLARDIEKLTETRTHLLEKCRGNKNNDVQIFSIDISRDFEEVRNLIKKAQESFGPVDVLINSAGFAIAQKCESIKIADDKRLMDVNYFGSVHCTKSVLGDMKERRNGRIVFISSQAGQFGLYGYSGYSASKFAIRGFAECIQMEGLPRDVRVSIAYPPDTKTPGYDEEMKNKPIETSIISAESGLYEAPFVAKKILKGVLDGKFNIPVGIDGLFLSTLTSGMSPATHIFEAAMQVLTMGMLRFVSLLYLFKFNRSIAGCDRNVK